MSTTLTTIQNNIFLLLNEPTDSNIGELTNAVSGSPAQTTLATFTELINQYSARMCKSCVAFEDTGTFTWTNGTLTVPYASFTTTGGGTLWSASSVSWNSISLKQTQKSYIKINYPTLLTDTPSASLPPKFWYQEGQSSVGIAPSPSASQTVKAWGYATPPLLVSGSDTASWIQDDEMLYISYGVACEIARKNVEDPNSQMKLPIWTNEFAAAEQRLWARLLQTSPGVARAYFTPPASVQQLTEQTAQ